MSGGSPAWMFVVSLVLNASFSRGVISNLTPGCAAVNAFAMSAHLDIIGSVLAMCHHRMVFVALPEPDLPLPLLHAPRSVAPAPAPASPSNDLRSTRIDVIDEPSLQGGASERRSYRKFRCRGRKVSGECSGRYDSAGARSRLR